MRGDPLVGFAEDVPSPFGEVPSIKASRIVC
jgi:hypothetical protein